MTRLVVITIITIMSIDRLLAVSPMTTDSISIDIYFRSGSHVFDADYKLNGLNLDSLFRMITSKPSFEIKEISIVSSASPEGNTLLNQRLSEKRTEVARSLISILPGIDTAHWTVSSIGIDWQGLADKVEESKMKSSDEILSIINNIPEWIVKEGTVVDSRKLRLKLLDNNRPWQAMERDIFPELRVSCLRVVYTYH